MNNTPEVIPFDTMMCMNQFAGTVGYVASMQGDPRVESACKMAERRCQELFEEFYATDDRTAFLTMLGYLAMDIAANIDHTLDRAQIQGGTIGGDDDRD